MSTRTSFVSKSIVQISLLPDSFSLTNAKVFPSGTNLVPYAFAEPCGNRGAHPEGSQILRFLIYQMAKYRRRQSSFRLPTNSDHLQYRIIRQPTPELESPFPGSLDPAYRFRSLSEVTKAMTTSTRQSDFQNACDAIEQRTCFVVRLSA